LPGRRYRLAFLPRRMFEAWRVGCSALIPEKSKESNQVRCGNVGLLPVTTILPSNKISLPVIC
ncbi:hypothetical protein L9F63_005607, partial [Diploptera punctata]